MAGNFIDLAVSLFFLTALIFTAKSKSHISEENSEAYKYISFGLSILSLSSVSHLCFFQGFFDTIPFLSEELFYSLTFWILNITGIILLANGITYWLPLNQSLRKYNKQHFRHISLLRDLEQLISIEKRADNILNKSLEHMVEHFDATWGVVYMYSNLETKLYYLNSTGITNDQLANINLNNDILRKRKFDKISFSNENIFNFTGEMTTPQIILPVLVDNKVAAVYLLWFEGLFTYEDDQLILKNAVEIVARAIKSRKDDLALKHYYTSDKQLERIQNIIIDSTDVRDNLIKVVKYLKSIIDIDYLSLYIEYSPKDIHRFTIGSNGTILCEKGLDQSFLRAAKVMVHQNDRIEIVRESNINTYASMKSLLKKSNMKTLISLSLENNKGLLLIGSEIDRSVSNREIYLLQKLRTIFGHYISKEINKFNKEMLTGRSTVANKLLGEILTKGSEQQAYEKAVRVIMKELRTSLVRISSFEEDGTFLKSRAMSVVHPHNDLIPEDGYMVMSLMPTIQKIRESGKTELINQDNPDCRISMAEAGQIYSTALNTALLVPIKVGNEVVGIISLADRRKGTRYQYTDDDIMFISLIAKILSVSLNMNSIEYSTKRDRFRVNKIRNIKQTPEIKNSIRSLLFGINGSVEMIKSHYPQNEENLNRYFNIIDRNINLINERIADSSQSVNHNEHLVKL
ncbi:MAG: GAF domain-containing protein [bacterium]